jgi:hypothetical protein
VPQGIDRIFIKFGMMIGANDRKGFHSGDSNNYFFVILPFLSPVTRFLDLKDEC